MNTNTKIAVLDLIVGKIGDVSTDHIAVMKAAVGLKSVLKATAIIEEKSGKSPIEDINNRLRSSNMRDLEATYATLVNVAVDILRTTEQDLYREALSGEELEGI